MWIRITDNTGDKAVIHNFGENILVSCDYRVVPDGSNGTKTVITIAKEFTGLDKLESEIKSLMGKDLNIEVRSGDFTIKSVIGTFLNYTIIASNGVPSGLIERSDIKVLSEV